MAKTKGRSRGRRGRTSSTVTPTAPAASRVAVDQPATPTTPRSNGYAIWLGAAVALVVAALYAVTAPRDIVLGDTPEFMLDAKILGVAHAPGYPLLTMLGAVFSNLPFGTTPFRLDLLAVA